MALADVSRENQHASRARGPRDRWLVLAAEAQSDVRRPVAAHPRERSEAAGS
jgi:hypothetical protein